ncbi:MAG: glycosyltransferase, partial [Candidatus Limnocylindrales bacterium]
MTTPPSDSQLDVLLVATWFPALDDPIAGRFVADQAEALLETGRVRPAVVSFEPAAVIGAGRLRSRLAETVRREAAGAVRNHPEVFAPRGHDSAAGIPLARPSIPGGRDPAAGPLHAALGREAVLGALADRWLGAVVPGPAPGDLPGPLSVPLPALIHGHTVYPDGAAAATLARRLGRPLFLTEHASFVGRLIAEPAIRRRYLETVAAAERLLVVSHTLAGELATALPEIASRITVVPNAVDLRSFPLAPASERRPAELLYVGYRKASKGTETLLTAFAQLHARRPEVTLRLVGRSPDAVIERGWHRLAGELGVAEAVRFEGPADRAGVAAALARATLFVHPSSRETFGIV